MSVERMDGEGDLERLACELNTALAGALATLAYCGAISKSRDIDVGMLSISPLRVIPVDAGRTRLRLVGGPGLATNTGGAIEMAHDHGTMDPAPEDIVRDLVERFPPDRGGTALLIRDGDPFAAVATYHAREIGLSFHVLWTLGNVRTFAQADDAVRAAGVAEDEVEDLAQAVRNVATGNDVTVTLATGEASPRFG